MNPETSPRISEHESSAGAAPTYEEVSGGGERVTHLFPNDCYFAHLSIYYFARQLYRGGRVLDAGSGGGYGSNYLAEQGVESVDAIELSDVAVRFSRKSFQRSNLRYQVMDLENISGFPGGSFDLIFTSNVLEHVPNVIKFVRSAWSLLKADGTMVVAVPPIVREVDWAENIANIYHLNIWTPRQWHKVLSDYFGEVECFWHGLRAGLPLDFSNTPEQTVINERDFVFKTVPVDHFYDEPSLTIIFVVRNPRPESELPSREMPVVFLEGSFTRPLPAENVPAAEADSRQARGVPVRARGLNHLLVRAKAIAGEGGVLALFPAAIRHLKWRIGSS